MLEYKAFICDCVTPEHQFVVYKDDDEDQFFYVQVRLNHYGTFWQRLKWASAYIFKKREASYDEVILRKDKIEELQKFLSNEEI